MTTEVPEGTFHLQISNLTSPNTSWELSPSLQKPGKKIAENTFHIVKSEKEVQPDYIFQSGV